MDDFVNWLNQQIEAKGWTYAVIARRGGISKSMVSRVVSRQSQPGLEFCKAVAKALDEAGKLPWIGPSKTVFLEAIEGHVLAEGELVGRHTRESE